MRLKEIYRPIKKELKAVEQVLKTSLKNTGYNSISEITTYLLDSKGKKLRPALVILSAKAAQEPSINKHSMVSIAAAMELIHTASLIHDDVIDHAALRHNKPTINSKYGRDVSIAMGDYLYSVGFNLISSCGNKDILSCISQATKTMCEGELIQVCERSNLNLLKERYILIVKKKTASLFAASCQAGAMVSSSRRPVYSALKAYGLNFGIAFQIIDDCLDLIGREEDLGKPPGADLKIGELTLPVLNLLSQAKDRNKIISLIKEQHDPGAFKDLKEKFIDSPALIKTKIDTLFYIHKAKAGLNNLEGSEFKESLLNLADFAAERIK